MATPLAAPADTFSPIVFPRAEIAWPSALAATFSSRDGMFVGRYQYFGLSAMLVTLHDMIDGH